MKTRNLGTEFMELSKIIKCGMSFRNTGIPLFSPFILKKRNGNILKCGIFYEISY
jgi:hypothetical protein